MDNKKIAIIGANEAVTVLINKAKQMGYETHVFAWACGDPGEKAADVFYPISIADKDAILEQCRKIGIEGVCSITSDFAAPVVSYIARNLGLVGNPERTDIVARNKYQMRCALKDAGLYTPFFCQVGEDFNLECASELSYPVIVKPTDRWSSKGVTRVDSADQLKAAVTYAVAESFDHKAIIEGFMNGPEYSAECICYRGEYHILAFTQKQTTGYPHYIETGHIQPSDIPEGIQETIKKTIYRALKALDIENGAAHVEFRILDNGEIGIIEIGARMGGDCIGTDLTPLSTGMDYVGMVVDVACGNRPSLNAIGPALPVRIKFITNHEDLQEYEQLHEKSPETMVRASEFTYNFDDLVMDSSTRHGYYIYYV